MTTQIQQFENHITKLREVVDLKELVLKLENNRDFQQFIEVFCFKECARYTHMSADPSLSPTDRENALAMARAGGHVLRYLEVTKRMGNRAEAEIIEAQNSIDEIQMHGEEESN